MTFSAKNVLLGLGTCSLTVLALYGAVSALEDYNTPSSAKETKLVSEDDVKRILEDRLID